MRTESLNVPVKPEPSTGLLPAVILATLVFAVVGSRQVVLAFQPELTGYPRWAAISATQVLVCLVAAMVVLKRGLRSVAGEFALTSGLFRAILFGLVVTAPMPLSFALVSPWAGTLDGTGVLFSAGVSPFTEEVVYRGFAFWLLYRRAAWGFWPAALVPTALFSVLHMSQATGSLAAFAILAITAVGGFWFSWLLMRWETLWVPILTHGLMNLWWELFAVDDTALGGLLGVGARVVTVLLAIAVTLLWARRVPRERAKSSSTESEVPSVSYEAEGESRDGDHLRVRTD